MRSGRFRLLTNDGFRGEGRFYLSMDSASAGCRSIGEAVGGLPAIVRATRPHAAGICDLGGGVSAVVVADAPVTNGRV